MKFPVVLSSEENFVTIGDHEVENLQLFEKSLKKENIIFLSCKPMGVVSAIKQGFVTIPIAAFEAFDEVDIQLQFVEKYLFSMK